MTRWRKVCAIGNLFRCPQSHRPEVWAQHRTIVWQLLDQDRSHGLLTRETINAAAEVSHTSEIDDTVILDSCLSVRVGVARILSWPLDREAAPLAAICRHRAGEVFVRQLIFITELPPQLDAAVATVRPGVGGDSHLIPMVAVPRPDYAADGPLLSAISHDPVCRLCLHLRLLVLLLWVQRFDILARDLDGRVRIVLGYAMVA